MGRKDTAKGFRKGSMWHLRFNDSFFLGTVALVSERSLKIIGTKLSFSSFLPQSHHQSFFFQSAATQQSSGYSFIFSLIQTFMHNGFRDDFTGAHTLAVSSTCISSCCAEITTLVFSQCGHTFLSVPIKPSPVSPV